MELHVPCSAPEARLPAAEALALLRRGPCGASLRRLVLRTCGHRGLADRQAFGVAEAAALLLDPPPLLRELQLDVALDWRAHGDDGADGRRGGGGAAAGRLPQPRGDGALLAAAGDGGGGGGGGVLPSKQAVYRALLYELQLCGMADVSGLGLMCADPGAPPAVDGSVLVVGVVGGCQVGLWVFAADDDWCEDWPQRWGAAGEAGW